MTCATLIPVYGNCALSTSDNLAPSELACHDMSDWTNQLDALARTGEAAVAEISKGCGQKEKMERCQRCDHFIQPLLTLCHLTLSVGERLSLPSPQPECTSCRCRANSGNRIKGERVQKYRRGVRQAVAVGGRKRGKTDYEKEMECVGRSLTRHLVFFCRRWNMSCEDRGSQTNWLWAPSLYCLGCKYGIDALVNVAGC